MRSLLSATHEWLEPDGLGGFASGTVAGSPTRRYHALLLVATDPPVGRMVLVNTLSLAIETSLGSIPLFPPPGSFPAPDLATGEKPGELSSGVSTAARQALVDKPPVAPRTSVDSGQGATGGLPTSARLIAFRREPWPQWTWQIETLGSFDMELFVPHRRKMCVLRFRLRSPQPAILAARPWLTGRDYHALHPFRSDFRFEPTSELPTVVWKPHANVPAVVAWANAEYEQSPLWQHDVTYALETERGLDDREDLASPGVFRWNLSRDAWLVLADESENAWLGSLESNAARLGRLRGEESHRRGSFASALHRAADGYIVARGKGQTIVAGYPWFTDWGRDTFIALRGLCLATHRFDVAREILLAWAGTVSQGMLPNRFPDTGEAEYNSVDAALWYIIAVHDYWELRKLRGRSAEVEIDAKLRAAVQAILEGYAKGTRYGIALDDDGLITAGTPGVQLTWMDAKVGDWVVTPRIGKPVEIQALWLNALATARDFAPEWQPWFERGSASFEERFWNRRRECLFDVVDVDHISGKQDDAIRPNQIFAVGGLPLAILTGERAAAVVKTVHDKLWTPLGLRTLDPLATDYAPHYVGGIRERDGAYHQGTAWPWLLGPFVEAWLRVEGPSAPNRRIAFERFVLPLLDHLEHAGLGHVSEIVDADPPHAPRGCPFQAWSLGELLRLLYQVVKVPGAEVS